VFGDYARFGTGLLAGLPWTLAGSRGEFTLAGQRYSYFFHPHQWTWLTERSVEVPIVRRFLDRYAGKRVLEVGNVLAHYCAHSHLVVDKYERGPGVLNRDVLDVEDLGSFDLVISISTLEHVGWDEEPRDAEKAVEAVRRLEALVAPSGCLVLTIPVGYHPTLDAAIQSGALSFTCARALRRSELGPHWHELPPEQAWGTPYDFLLYGARAVFVGVTERPSV
jgi:hypothetical protein